jgi:hypothetical protein
MPVPCSTTLCVDEGLAFRVSSLKTGALEREPPLCGTKLMLRLQLALGASEL